VLELLRAIYNFGINHSPPLYTGENPAAKSGRFTEPERLRFLESHEAPRFFEALFSETDQDFRDFVLLSILVGARRRNMLRMRWDELSLDGAKWRLSGEEMKSGRPLEISLVQKAVDILRRRSRKVRGEWVFPGGTASGHMGAPRKRWAKFLKRAGVVDLHLHDLRRTLGSWMTMMGANTVTIMEALGHKDYDAALRYQRIERSYSPVSSQHAPVLAAMQQGVSGLFEAAKAGKPGKRRASSVRPAKMPPRKPSRAVAR
jgi:integrase